MTLTRGIARTPSPSLALVRRIPPTAKARLDEVRWSQPMTPFLEAAESLLAFRSDGILCGRPKVLLEATSKEKIALGIQGDLASFEADLPILKEAHSILKGAVLCRD